MIAPIFVRGWWLPALILYCTAYGRYDYFWPRIFLPGYEWYFIARRHFIRHHARLVLKFTRNFGLLRNTSSSLGLLVSLYTACKRQHEKWNISYI
jgi:hypothetical protein